MAAEKFFEPQQLQVLKTKPKDERTSHIHDTFTKLAESTGNPTGQPNNSPS